MYTGRVNLAECHHHPKLGNRTVVPTLCKRLYNVYTNTWADNCMEELYLQMTTTWKNCIYKWTHPTTVPWTSTDSSKQWASTSLKHETFILSFSVSTQGVARLRRPPLFTCSSSSFLTTASHGFGAYPVLHTRNESAVKQLSLTPGPAALLSATVRGELPKVVAKLQNPG